MSFVENDCPCWSGSGWQQAHVIGGCRCRCTPCLARSSDLARERDRGGCYRCAWCGRRAVPEEVVSFVLARHARPAPRQLAICLTCWFFDLGAAWAGSTA